MRWTTTGAKANQSLPLPGWVSWLLPTAGFVLLLSSVLGSQGTYRNAWVIGSALVLSVMGMLVGVRAGLIFLKSRDRSAGFHFLLSMTASFFTVIFVVVLVVFIMES